MNAKTIWFSTAVLVSFFAASTCYGQIGDGTTQNRFVPLKILDGVEQISSGASYSLVVKKDGTMWVCGDNESGQLGTGSYDRSSVYVKTLEDVKSVSAGWNHTLIIKKDNSLWSCGNNEFGQLGDGTNQNQNKPVKVMDNVLFACASANHSLVLKDDGSAWGFGKNNSGELGDSSAQNRSKPIRILPNVKSIGVGMYHSLFLTLDGSLYGCGWNGYGQLGTNGEIVAKPTIIASKVSKVFSNPSSYVTLFQDESKSLWAYAFNRTILKQKNSKQSTPELIQNDVLAASAGEEHLLLVRADNSLWGIGGGSPNDYGLLGLIKPQATKKFIRISDDVQAISASVYNTLILKNDGTLWASGYNGDGGLM